MSADQVTAEDKEKIDTDPAKTIDAAGKFESEKRRVINDDYDDRKCTEKIEPRLAFAVGKARIDFELTMVSFRLQWRCMLMNARK